MTDTPKPATPPETPLADHGIPPEAGQEESKGLPNSDRETTETVPVRDVCRDI